LLADVEGGSPVIDQQPPPKTCVSDAGAAPSPDAEGLCGQYFLSATGDPPNLYFVIDRSGSMGQTVDGVVKYDAVAGAAVDLVRTLGSKVKVGAAVFPGPAVNIAPDPNQMPPDPCLVGEEVFSATLGDAMRVGPCDPDGPITRAFSGAISLPNNQLPVGSTPTAATLAAILPTLSELPGRTAVVLATDGGPNCNAGAACDESKCIPNIEHDPACPEGTNCCVESLLGPDAPKACLDDTRTLKAVQALHDKGIKTYVVGVPGSSPYAALLDQLAVAGGTGRLGSTAYYDVAHVSELGDVLDSIGAEVILSCHLRLDDDPPDHEQVNVYLDSRVLTYGSPDGWRWTGSSTDGGDDDASLDSSAEAAAPSYKEIDLTGAACSDLEGGKVRRLEITFGCKTEIVR
jgi:hypothetical protein